jgi:hypothetical protein
MMSPQHFVFALIHANQVKKHLESKNLKVESDFSARHAVMGMVLNNPWAFSLLMQQELHRLDTSTGNKGGTTNGQSNGAGGSAPQVIDISAIKSEISAIITGLKFPT